MSVFNKPPGVMDLVGQQFGELTVVSFSHMDYRHEANWLCKCSCGCGTVVSTGKLKSGHTRTCGHANITLVKHKEGYFPARDHPRLYGVWQGMKSRCYNKNNGSFPNYGGRGISVCDEWRSFGVFCEWALSNGYDETAKFGECTLDRIDVNGDYCPSNCRFVDAETQMNNKANNRVITLNGETDTLANWAKRLGLKYGTVMQRLARGHTVEEALCPVPNAYCELWERRKIHGAEQV